jgi:hypothetical protein
MIQFGFEKNQISEESQRDESYRQQFRRLLTGDLDFQGDNSVSFTHSWHAFPAKFPPQLPRLFIRELTRKGIIRQAKPFCIVMYFKKMRGLICCRMVVLMQVPKA